MEKIIVRGGCKLQGVVDISVAKNSVLPIIVATILNPTEIILRKVPMLEDVTVLINLLRELNCEVKFSPITGDLKINTLNLKEIEPNNESGSPKLIKAKYITANNKLNILLK